MCICIDRYLERHFRRVLHLSARQGPRDSSRGAEPRTRARRPATDIGMQRVRARRSRIARCLGGGGTRLGAGRDWTCRERCPTYRWAWSAACWAESRFGHALPTPKCAGIHRQSISPVVAHGPRRRRAIHRFGRFRRPSLALFGAGGPWALPYRTAVSAQAPCRSARVVLSPAATSRKYARCARLGTYCAIRVETFR